MVREASARKKQNRGSIWESARIKDMLKQPVGTPVALTRKEAIAIVRDAAGKRPDLPTGEEYVRRLSWIWSGLLKRRDG